MKYEYLCKIDLTFKSTERCAKNIITVWKMGKICLESTFVSA